MRINLIAINMSSVTDIILTIIFAILKNGVATCMSTINMAVIIVMVSVNPNHTRGGPTYHLGEPQ